MEEEEEGRSSPGVSEFVSDAYDGAALDQEDLRKEMEQLVLEPGKTPSPDGELGGGLVAPVTHSQVTSHQLTPGLG